jgi:LytS/YehU family sensor histidine kinase
LQTQLATAQLEILRAWIQPHFLFTTCNSTSPLMQEDMREVSGAVIADWFVRALRVSLSRKMRDDEDALTAEGAPISRFGRVVRWGQR